MKARLFPSISPALFVVGISENPVFWRKTQTVTIQCEQEHRLKNLGGGMSKRAVVEEVIPS